MPQITRDLLRKRAEHNEGIISTMEEISLHQEELESINEVLGKTCRKLKILYLQNNIIPKIENLQHMNFIDFDKLKESIEHLQSRTRLEELYLMGNPAQAHWEHFNSYVIAKLPQLKSLDGTEITKSMRIVAMQSLPRLERELEDLAEQQRLKKVAELPITADATNQDDDNELTENTPEVRVKIYQELAQQKKEKEDRARVNAPKERNYDEEQQEAVQSTRQKESEVDEKEIKQKNEGGWEFFWDEESRPGYVLLEVRVARFLDSSLIDVDIHPHYVSMVIKSKVLRLRLPAEVNVSDSKCQRSKSSGALLIIMPKTNPKENEVTIRGDIRFRKAEGSIDKNTFTPFIQGKQSLKKKSEEDRVRVKTTSKVLSLQEQMMQEASVHAQLANIVKQPVVSSELSPIASISNDKIVSIEELD